MENQNNEFVALIDTLLGQLARPLYNLETRIEYYDIATVTLGSGLREDMMVVLDKAKGLRSEILRFLSTTGDNAEHLITPEEREKRTHYVREEIRKLNTKMSEVLKEIELMLKVATEYYDIRRVNFKLNLIKKPKPKF